MTTMIAGQNHGRAIPTYDLLEEMTERYDIDRREAHDSIHAFLADLGDDAIVGTTPQRPELDGYNPNDEDRGVWLEITDEAAEHIREAFAATFAYTALIGTSADTVTGDYCDVMVKREVGVGSPELWTDLPVRVDDDDSLSKVEDAADRVLEAAGWRRVSEWEYETDGLHATVVRA